MKVKDFVLDKKECEFVNELSSKRMSFILMSPVVLVMLVMMYLMEPNYIVPIAGIVLVIYVLIYFVIVYP